MGLFQKAVETYDAHAALVGEYSENAEPLAPIGHILAKATVRITLTKDGKFYWQKPSTKMIQSLFPLQRIPAVEAETWHHIRCVIN